MHLLVLALLSLVLMIVSGIVELAFGVSSVKESGGASLFLLWNSFSQLLMFALPALIVARLYYAEDKGEFLRLDLSSRSWLLGLAGVGVLLLLTPLIDRLTTWNDAWHWSGQWESLEQKLRAIGQQSQSVVEEMMTNTHPLLALFGLALVPALCEELFFRAGIQNLLHRCFSHHSSLITQHSSLSTLHSPLSTHAAIWITAALFSLAHGEIFAFLPRFLLGALLGYLYVYGRSLLVNVIVHFTNNAIVVLAYAILQPSTSDLQDPTSMDIAWPWVALCTVAALATFWYVFVKRLKTSK